MAFELPPALPQERARAAYVGPDVRFPLRQASPGLCHQPEQFGEGHTPAASQSLEEIILANAKDESKIGVFNNAAQVWNHTFFWHCMKPNGGGAPTGALADKIASTFGDLDKFKEQFKAAAVGQFGSGWAWLVSEGGTLKIVKTGNAVTPLVSSRRRC